MATADYRLAEQEEQAGRRGSALRYTGVACVGFAVDWVIVHLGLWLGAPPWATRIVSLTTAMQVTFALNRMFVFKCPERETLAAQWVVYMATNAVGNLCNYFAYNTLLSLHRPVVSDHTVALAIGGVVAWAVNYLSARHLVFARGPSALLARFTGGSAAEPDQTSPSPGRPG